MPRPRFRPHIIQSRNLDASPVLGRPGRSEAGTARAAILIEQGLLLAALVAPDDVGAHYPGVSIAGGPDRLLVQYGVPDDFVGGHVV